MKTPPATQNCVLLVDPDVDARQVMRESVEESHLEWVEISTLAEALDYAAQESPRLVLSELVLPDGSGFALCRQLRESAQIAQVPIVLISRWNSERDRILAFECGADDFLAKPFFKRELASRIKAVLRRSPEPTLRKTVPHKTRSSRVEIDVERKKVRVEGRLVTLTPREFDLLTTLLRHEGCVMTRSDLIAEAWTSGENPTERNVDAHIKSLRRKLASERDLIETIRGLGYRFSDLGESTNGHAR